MKRSPEARFPNQRVTQDRRSRPTSLIGTLRFGGRRKGFRRTGEEPNRYVDLPSPRVIALTLIIFALSILDAVFTVIHLENGAFELNPVMDRIIRSGFQNALIVKSLGVGLIAWFLATHQNFKISFYGMYVLAGAHIALLAYHLVCAFLFRAI